MIYEPIRNCAAQFDSNRGEDSPNNPVGAQAQNAENATTPPSATQTGAISFESFENSAKTDIPASDKPTNDLGEKPGRSENARAAQFAAHPPSARPARQGGGE